MLLSNCRAWNELCLSYLWLFLFLYIASIIYTALLDLNYYSYARVNNSCGGEVERKSMWWCTFVLCYNSLVKQESTELYAALNIKAVRTKMCQEQYHISFKRVAKFGFFFCTLELWSFWVGIMFVFAHLLMSITSQPGVWKAIFFSVDLVNLLINRFDTNLIIWDILSRAYCPFVGHLMR